jgi:2-polyprenyl-6-methoxyphenol hydroxylase-like FAD-dependent oxidoreductase|tara:strand:+ start:50619 stop:52058 length:1440 start_codon:yes stop_codon:yes gene_type:complete
MKKILIVGSGASGLVAALSFAKQNISFDIIEKLSVRSKESKALSLNSASLKLFHSLGVIDDVMKKGKSMKDIYIYMNGKKISHIDKSRLDNRYNFFITLPQYITEDILEKKLHTYNVYIKYGHALTSLQKKGSSYIVSIDEDGKTSKTKYDYIIAADGKSSSVKSILNVDSVKYDYGYRFCVADIKLKTELKKSTIHYHINDKIPGFSIILPMLSEYTRVVLCSKRDLPTNIDLPYIESFLRESTGDSCLTLQCISWQSSTKFHHSICSNHLSDNIFFVGDAYHIFSPIGGMGMNTGMQDSLRISWIIAHIIQGIAKKSLLTLYTKDRYKEVLDILDLTYTHTNMILKKGDYEQSEIYDTNFSNRKHIKTTLPLIFSGYSSNYSAAISNDGGLIQHAKYLEFDKTNTFSLLSKSKYLLILNKKSNAPSLSHIGVIVILFSGKVREDEYILISPDSMIVLHEKLYKLNKVNDYLDTYYYA